MKIRIDDFEKIKDTADYEFEDRLTRRKNKQVREQNKKIREENKKGKKNDESIF
jgi:hypothetical protein